MKRKQISLGDKYIAIMAIKNKEKSQNQIAVEMSVGKSTVSGWMNESDKIIRAYEENVRPSFKKIRPSNFVSVDEKLYDWFKEKILKIVLIF